MARRERWSVMGDILEALVAEGAKGPHGRISNVAAKANIAYDRLQPYLDRLADRGLVTRDRLPALTPKGQEFLRQYRVWTAVLDDFGLG